MLGFLCVLDWGDLCRYDLADITCFERDVPAVQPDHVINMNCQCGAGEQMPLWRSLQTPPCFDYHVVHIANVAEGSLLGFLATVQSVGNLGCLPKFR